MRISNPVANCYTKQQINEKKAFLYKATFLLSGWTSADSDEKSNGYNYKQTVSLSSDEEGAPAITDESIFLSLGFFYSTKILQTDMTLSSSLSEINGGYSVSGSGNITTLTKNKPSSDITVYWLIKAK